MAKKRSSPDHRRDRPHRSDVARRIWLAGIGAYGQAFSDAQESLAKMNEDTSRVFDDLVVKGEEIEETVEEKGRALAKNVQAPAFSIDDRIKKMRARLGLTEGVLRTSDDDAADIDARLSSIEEKLDAVLAQLVGADASARRPARRTTKTKAPRKSSRKKSAS